MSIGNAPSYSHLHGLFLLYAKSNGTENGTERHGIGPYSITMLRLEIINQISTDSTNHKLCVIHIYFDGKMSWTMFNNVYGTFALNTHTHTHKHTSTRRYDPIVKQIKMQWLNDFCYCRVPKPQQTIRH